MSIPLAIFLMFASFGGGAATAKHFDTVVQEKPEACIVTDISTAKSECSLSK